MNSCISRRCFASIGRYSKDKKGICWSSLILILPVILALVNPITSFGSDTGVSQPTVNNTLFSGAATAGVPILVPPGRLGIQPNLTLSYNSYKKNGWIGMGWDIDMGAIRRSTKRGVDYSGNDYEVTLGGQKELVPRSNWGANFYGAKIEGGFTKYFYNSSTKGWEATDKSGVKYFFGTTAASRQDNPSDNNQIFKWCLDKVVDTNDNYMTISYVKDQGQIYLSRIDYTGNQGQAAISPSNAVIFHLEDGRPDQQITFNTNFKIKHSKRLKTIEVTSFHGVVRAYSFNYSISSHAPSSTLYTVKQYGSDVSIDSATGSIISGSLLANFLIECEYNSLVNYVSGPHMKPLESGNYGSTGWQRGMGDVNGDGKTDILYHYGSATGSAGIDTRVMLSDGNGFFTAGPYQEVVTSGNYGASNWQRGIGDVNGDGRADILFFSGSSSGSAGIDTRVLFSNGDGTFTAGPYQEPVLTGIYGSTGWQRSVGDVNSDGKADILYHYGSATGSAGIDTVILISNGDGTFTAGPHQKSVSSGNYGASNWQRGIGDVNGDGRVDILFFSGSSSGSAGIDTRVLLSNGDGTFTPGPYQEPVLTGNYGMDGWQRGVGDVNGDGFSDILYSYASATGEAGVHLRALMSNGDGTFTPGPYQQPVTTGKYNATGWERGLGDVDGDGKTDLMFHFSSTSGHYGIRVKSLISNGDGRYTPGDLLNPVTAGNYGPYQRVIADITGSGKSDLFCIFGSINTNSGISIRSVKSNPMPANMLKSIESASGSVTSFDYANSSEYNHILLPYIMHPLRIITVDDGNGGVSITQYAYIQGLFDFQDREFRGFGWSITTNPDGTLVETKFHQGEYDKGMKYLTEFKTSNGTLLSKESLTWSTDFLDSPANTHAFLKLSSKRSESYDGVTTFTQEDYTYDDTNGNVMTHTLSGTGAESITTIGSYGAFGSWLWRKTSETITGSSSGQVRKTDMTYEQGTGNLLSKMFNLDGSNSPTIYTSYDAYGNPITVTDARGYSTNTLFDADTHTFPISVEYPETNGISHVEQTLTIDYRFGIPLLTEDENGNQTTYSYDVFGRMIQTDLPNGGQVINEYYDTANPRYTVSRVKEDAVGNFIDTFNYFDGLNRQIQSVTRGENSQYIVNRVHYDEMSRPYYTEGPFFASSHNYSLTAPADSPWSLTVFDDRGRPVSVESPDGAHVTVASTISYNGHSKTVTDPDNGSKTEEIDYLGRLVKVVEHADQADYQTIYAYNAAGDLLSVTDHNGNQTLISYDTLGRKIGMSDPDMGNWSYTYDANSNLLTQTDAKNQVITFSYDPLNRLASKTYSTSDPTITYAYDDITITNGRGRLSSVTNGLVTTTIDDYDTMGNVLSETRIISGAPQSYTTETTYDLSGKPVTTTYPDNFSVTNSYIPGTGLLLSVTGSDSVVYAQMSNYTPTGKIGRIDYGNLTYTEHDYDNESGRLQSLTTKRIGPADTMQERSYSYTPAGNISGITNIKSGISYSYNYDKLHRLTGETNTGSTPALSYSYDAIGNITFKTKGPDNLSYSYAGTRPHAVSAITYAGNAYSFVYDDNGNMITGPDFTDLQQIGTRSLTYNADNMPINVSSTKGGVTKSMSLTYDGDGVRTIKAVNNGATTFYVGGHFQEIQTTTTNIETTRFIFAGNFRVAQIKDGVAHYFHKDHLGSSTIMSDASGLTLETTEYLPYGGERSHSGNNISEYKFTDQELDPETGLYNYNARLYDPVVGLFITADSIVPGFSNPQTLNRYMYCLGNPLRYTDPTGHFSIGDFFKSFASGVVGGTAFVMSGGLAAPALSLSFFQSVALAGACSGATSAALNGGDLGDIATSAAMGGVGGVVSGGLASIVSGPAVMLASAAYSLDKGGLDGLSYWAAAIGGGYAGSGLGQSTLNYIEGNGFVTNSTMVNSLWTQGKRQEAINFVHDKYGIQAKGIYDPTQFEGSKSTVKAKVDDVHEIIYYRGNANDQDGYLIALAVHEGRHIHQLQHESRFANSNGHYSLVAAEQDAYNYQLRESWRLSLTWKSLKNIWNVRNDYYPGGGRYQQKLGHSFY